MSKDNKKRDREVTRAINRLFWRANFIDYWSVPVCIVLRIVAYTCFHLLIPLSIAYGLQAIFDRRFDAIETYAWQIILWSFLYCVFISISTVVIDRMGVNASAWLQKQVFANYLNKDHDFYGNTYFGSLGAQATRLRDAFNEHAVVFLMSIPKQATVVMAGLVVIASKSLSLAAVTLVAMFLVLSFTLLSGTWRLTYRRRVSEAASDIAGQIGDALTQASVVKSFGTEKYEEKRLDSTLAVWKHAQNVSWNLSAPADAGRTMLAALTTAVLLIMTARMYQDNTISIAIVALIQLYVIKMVGATQDIAEIIKSHEHVMGGAYQPIKTMMIEPTINDPKEPQKLPHQKQLQIGFNNVGYHYPETAKTARAVANFTLDIAKGEKIGLVGRSGSGKTTLTKLLLRFMDLDEGTITVGGIAINQTTQHELRRAIAYVPQEPLLFHRSIAENIGYGNPRASRKKIHEASKLAYVDEFVDDLPNGLETFVGERGVKLSGGQRQRVAIARAILKDAPILVLDEATSALDSSSERLIQEALWHLMKDRTALVIAHRLSTIQRMDRIVVMDKGNVVQIGTHDQLLRDKSGVYAELWAHQSGGYIGVPEPSTD